MEVIPCICTKQNPAKLQRRPVKWDAWLADNLKDYHANVQVVSAQMLIPCPEQQLYCIARFKEKSLPVSVSWRTK